MAVDPISNIAIAVDDLEKLIVTESALTHPLMFMWRIHRMINILTKECKKNKNIDPISLVYATCHDLDITEQGFILKVVQDKLK